MKRILVADDSVTIQKVITLTFADEPFEVQSVGTGAEALELVKSWKPDIVLADVIMPQMNGYELCRAVKQQEATSSVPVLLLAGTFEAFDEEEAKSVGASDFITKPFESGELIEKVKTLIGDVPAVPAAEEVSPADEPAVPPAQAAAPVPPPQTDAPVTAAAGDDSEPDIWDILSDSGDDVQQQAAQSGSPGPGFGPIEDTGVVDVGSFDVGIGRPESPPSAPEPVPPASSPVEGSPAEGGIEEPAPQEMAPETAPPADSQLADQEERSRVENMEKDFFGFETGAVEEVPATDFLEDAVEEVTFEVEQPQAVPEAEPQEISFIVPEPAGDQAVVTGETVSPDFMAPEPPPVTLQEQSPEPVEGPAPPAPPAPSPVEGSPIEEPPPPVESAIPPAPEPPLELPVDLTQELPEGFSPEPTVEQAAEVPGPGPATDTAGAPVPEPTAEVSSQVASDAADDAAIRKIVEEKVEKIAWEVVPEMAEVIIREAIQKIKDGT